MVKMKQLEVEEVCPKRKLYPMVVNFQNAYITEEYRESNCLMFVNQDNNKNTVVTELDNIIYTGDEEEEDVGRVLLLARDKKTGKVRIIESGHLNLKPVIRNNLDTSQLLETSNLELSRKFGSKKQKKEMEQREKLKTNVETIKMQVEKATEKISEDQLDLSSYDSATLPDDFYLPPIDRKATRLEDVYDINKILTEDEFDTISSEIGEKDYKPEMSPWVLSLIEKSNSKTHQVLGLYASCLIKFYSTAAKEMKTKGFAACKSSHTLHKVIMKNFSSVAKGQTVRVQNFKDKAFCHAIVFVLLINNYKCSLTSICEEFKIAQPTVLKKLRVIGATVVTSGSTKTVQLKYPLNFKPMFRRKTARF
ncbi:DNA-directed RNA polymerase I subunit RPA49-like [Zerene cesonia]|uniref:DNA-directed RNA polymerase I subunit RPA49-like n=1 Tax=Zerene cesonia TaxID=33412 RepID=UPI0018E509EA|nr:DNA-directed RNA polymerase I subunit RPA49-like [Zerene cesonia]